MTLIEMDFVYSSSTSYSRGCMTLNKPMLIATGQKCEFDPTVTLLTHYTLNCIRGGRPRL